MVLMIVLTLLGMAAGVHAQAVDLVECPHVSFFGPACEDEEPPPPAQKRPAKPSHHAMYDYLFPRETLSRETPEMLIAAVKNPTKENIDRYLAWQAQRQAWWQAFEKQLITRQQERNAQ